jgi:hypothetical protein
MKLKNKVLIYEKIKNILLEDKDKEDRLNIISNLNSYYSIRMEKVLRDVKSKLPERFKSQLKSKENKLRMSSKTLDKKISSRVFNVYDIEKNFNSIVSKNIRDTRLKEIIIMYSKELLRKEIKVFKDLNITTYKFKNKKNHDHVHHETIMDGKIPAKYTVRNSDIEVKKPLDAIFEDIYKLCMQEKPNKYAYKVFSGFRNYEAQVRLYNDRMNLLKKQYRKYGYISYVHSKTKKEIEIKNPNKKQYEKVCRKFVAKPGGSKHQHGNAIDVFFQRILIPNDVKKNPTKKYQRKKKHFLSDDAHDAHIEEIKKTVFYKTFKKYASMFNLKPYKGEPWHWEMDKDTIEVWKNWKKGQDVT